MSFIPPNWRNASEYPSTEEHASLSFWAWQFLRRNKEYQAEWEGYVRALYQMAKRVPELLPFVRLTCDVEFRSSSEAKMLCSDRDALGKLEDLAGDQLEYIHMDPSPSPSEQTVGQYEERMERDGARGWSLTPKSFVLGEKWGLKYLENPSAESLGLLNGFLVNGASFRSIGHVNNYADDKNYIVPVFDMRLPVAVLRKQFEFLLSRRASNVKRGKVVPYGLRPDRQFSLYREYIRVLDAVDAGENNTDIATALLPHQDKEGSRKAVKNWSNAAEKIRKSDYQLLPAYSEISAREDKKRSKEK
jgi:hypothetical protein